MTKIPFESLPQRIFLDSSTLQMLHDYGGSVWENEPFPDNDKIHCDQEFQETVEALRCIFFVNQRALWEFALSTNSLREVADKGEASYLQWAYDVLDHWQTCIEEIGPPSSRGQKIALKLQKPSFNYLSEGDRKLLYDALALECDAFLTCDRRLARNRNHLNAELSILVLTPIQHWEILRPWAKLFV